MKLLLAVAALTLGDGLPARSPAAVGMSATRLAKIDHVVERGLRAGGFPGASVVVGRKGFAVWEKGFGRLGWTPSSGYVVPERTIYDIASLTKVVGTTTALMLLHDEGKVRLSDKVSRFLPGFSGGMKDQVTIEMLLTHRGGLAAGRDIWRIARTPADARAAVINSAIEYRPGTKYVYSDLGADLLGFVAEAAAGESLDAYLRRRVFTPLGMEDTGFRPDRSLRDRIAPTDVTSPRGYPIRGEVHDENAFALGGIAGHAGLFSTATDLSVFAQMMLNGGEYNGIRLLKPETVELFTRRRSGSRALGWDTCAESRGTSSCGKYLSARAYGHTGFTGTSLWIDPDREMFVILLTNRVHAAKARRPARVIADVRADVADAASLAVMDFGDVPSMPSAFRADRAVGWNTPARTVSRGRARAASKSKRTVVRSKAKRSASKSKATVKKSKATTKKKPSPARKRSTTVKKKAA